MTWWMIVLLIFAVLFLIGCIPVGADVCYATGAEPWVQASPQQHTTIGYVFSESSGVRTGCGVTWTR